MTTWCCVLSRRVINHFGNGMQGSTPSTQKALDLYHVLSESGPNLRQPVELETQLLKHMPMDSEVGRSMLQLLQVRLPAALLVIAASTSKCMPGACFMTLPGSHVHLVCSVLASLA